MRLAAACLIASVLAACAHQQPTQAIPAGATYVAMGSSFAAGPGILPYVENPSAPCARSSQNYARQIARRHNLNLIDVGCSGGTTHHLLGPREVAGGDAIPPQLDALTADTRLVTITIGGNDLNYMSRLINASCTGLAAQDPAAPRDCRPVATIPSEADYAALAGRMKRIADEVRRRSPQARLVLVDYFVVLPASSLCPGTPLRPAEADADREIARRLAAITAQAARDAGAGLVTLSTLSIGHDACSPDAWINGYARPGAPIEGAAYHPNLKGMTAAADALDRLLWR
jgi:lysophospholipase L1-like esterase